MEDRTNIREKHGIANARKVSMAAVDDSELQAVIVTDGHGEVLLSLSTSSYPAALTPEQATLLAAQLRASVTRLSKALS